MSCGCGALANLAGRWSRGPITATAPRARRLQGSLRGAGPHEAFHGLAMEHRDAPRTLRKKRVVRNALQPEFPRVSMLRVSIRVPRRLSARRRSTSTKRSRARSPTVEYVRCPRGLRASGTRGVPHASHQRASDAAIPVGATGIHIVPRDATDRRNADLCVGACRRRSVWSLVEIRHGPLQAGRCPITQ